jgi:hypothetical protein
MSSLIESTALVLVSVMNKPRDLEIARLLGWYRIPLRSAPKVIFVDYLAFYQTSAFPHEKQRIQYIAPVKGHELVRRIDLLQDEPNHPQAQQEYYKIQLGALQSLKQPILADEWRRITFFYTTGEYLNKANSIKDLIVPSEERERLWKALRDRAAQGLDYQTPGIPEIELAPEVLAMLLGIKEAEEDYRSG